MMQSGPQHHATSPDTPEAARRRRRFALLFALCSVVAVLGTTLYPFEFTTEGYESRLQACLNQRLVHATGLSDDILTNVLLFLPFGFAFAHLASRRGFGLVKAFVLVVLTGAALSTFVEFLQLFLPFRFTSFIDIYANAGGTALGSLLHALLGKHISRQLREAVARPNNRETIRWLTAAYLAHFACAALLTVFLLQSLRIYDWDLDYPLMLGNVHSGNRPWRGMVERLTFAKYALDDPLVTKSLQARRLHVPKKEFLLCDYEPGNNSSADRVKKLPSLVVKGRPAVAREEKFRLNSNQWLETEGSAAYLSSWLMATSEFTMFTRIKSASTTQAGWGRIVAIDNNPYEVNFALTQTGDQLGIRFRSMTSGIGAYAPGFTIPGVFTDTLAHTIVITRDRLMLRVYIDTREREYSFMLGPGLALFNRFMPTHKSLDITSPFSMMNEILLGACVFLPLGYFLAFIALGFRHRFRLLLFVTFAGLAGPVLAFKELFLFFTLAEMPREYLSLISVLILLGFVCTLCVQLKKQRAVPEVFESFVPPASLSIHQHSK